MEKLNNKTNTAVLKVPFNKIDQNIESPQLDALLNSGWEIIWCIPVEDNGAKLVIILKTKNKSSYLNMNFEPLVLFLKIHLFMLFLLLTFDLIKFFIME